MDKYLCEPCGYIYDPAIGDPEGGIAPGTAFEDIPDDWVCPICGVGKDMFVKAGLQVNGKKRKEQKPMKKCEMFCYQCQETARGTGCTKVGVCGKRPELSSMLDLLIYVTKGLACVTTKLREEGKKEIGKDSQPSRDRQPVYYDYQRELRSRRNRCERIKETLKVKEDLRSKPTDLDSLPEAALWNGSESEFDAKADSDAVGVLSTENEDIPFLAREMITYGLKGLAAYSEHANALMQDNEKIDAFPLSAHWQRLWTIASQLDDLVALTLETGKFGVDGMALLDSANTGAYGNPEITEVNIGVRNNPGILISGHDLKDLEQLLEQTKGTGVDVYTHSEMLPAHYYPAFKKYDHFAGNYGNAWWKQKEEFETFNGPILIDHELHRSSCRFLQGQTVDNRCRRLSGMPPHRRRVRNRQGLLCHHRTG